MDGLIAYALAKKYTDKVGQDIISAGFKVQVEDNRSILNRQGEEKVLYLLPKEYGSSQDGYDEFVYANNTWEWVGKTDVNLDYTALENLPQIRYYTNSGGTIIDNADYFIGTIGVYNNGVVKIIKYGNEFDFDVNYERTFTVNANPRSYDIDNFHTTAQTQPKITYARARDISHLPNFVSGKKDTKVYIVQYSGYNASTVTQELYWIDPNNKAHTAFRLYSTGTSVRTVTDWQELTGGGSQIVSGVVNANGTITFTDSEGNSFTTSGESVIGPQGAPGQDYVLTAQDKSDIADIVLGELPTTQGVLYGNQSN